MVEIFVEVEFVIVPFVELIEESEIFPADKVVIVALVRVALVPTKLSVFVVEALVVEAEMFCEFSVEELSVEIFPVIALVVVEFVVDAFRVAKLAVVPNKVPIVAEVKLAIAAYRVESTFKFVIDEVAATSELVFRLVDVELVIVPFATLIEGSVRFVNERLVIVADVRVAFPPAMLAVVMFAVEIFEVVELDVEAYIF